MKERTPAYICTFHFQPSDDRAFKMTFARVVRESFTLPASGTEPASYIRIRGRLGRNNPYAYLYRRGGKLYRSSSQDIRVEHAQSIDVYTK